MRVPTEQRRWEVKTMIQEHDWRTNHDARIETIEEAVRTVSKLGTIMALAEVFRELAAFLTKGEVIQLYKDLRESRRPEREWRPEFLAIFSGIQETDLPPIVYDQLPASAEETPERFRPPKTPLNIRSDGDIPF
jgi:hypothetical protein